MTTEHRQTILWIHGFCGKPNNETFLEMQKCSPQYDWHSIEVDHHALASVAKINEYIHSHDVCLVAECLISYKTYPVLDLQESAQQCFAYL